MHGQRLKNGWIIDGMAKEGIMPETNFVFRKMAEKDILDVASLEKRLFSRPWSEQSLSQALRQSTLFVTALEKNIVVGYCGMYCGFGEGEITNVAVDPIWQNQGVGRKMLEYLLEQAYCQGIRRVMLEVRVSNWNAIHLYESMGFRSCGIRKQLYDLPTEDGMVMEFRYGG